MKAKSQTKYAKKLAISSSSREALSKWKGIMGVFRRGPKDPVKWQRQIRKDRKIL